MALSVQKVLAITGIVPAVKGPDRAIFPSYLPSSDAALAVQKVIVSENLLENYRIQGAKPILKERLLGPNMPAAPFVFDIRGGGCFWGVEFDFNGPEGAALDFRGQQFASLIQAQTIENGLLIIGLTGGANLRDITVPCL
ncbi:hypothetical protein C8R43DRAFT_1191844 [Mycena crocata]|nr:hypothetical protein C8R43DRAFT_1191844 [Mycena crocata]